MAFEFCDVCADVKIEDAQGGVVKCVPPRKRVALVGFGTNTRYHAPFNNPEFEIWGMNQAHVFMPRRADRWFEIHKDEFTPDMRDPEYETFLARCPIPVYMQRVRPGVPSSVRFPIEKLLGEFKIDYFTSSIAYMIALAIYEGFQEISLWGIDLVTDEEYASQKPCVEWWLGVAYGRGVNIYVPDESALLKQPWRYGYEVNAKWGGVDPNLIETEMEDYMKRRDKAWAEFHTMNGAVQYAKHVHGLIQASARGTIVQYPKVIPQVVIAPDTGNAT